MRNNKYNKAWTRKLAHLLETNDPHEAIRVFRAQYTIDDRTLRGYLELVRAVAIKAAGLAGDAAPVQSVP